MKNLIFSIISIMTLFVFSCKKDNNKKNLDNLPPFKEKNYSIIIVDESNQPIANAEISDGSNTITSNTSGTAIFKTPGETYGKYRFGISKDGYFTGSLNLFNFADPDTTYKVMLLKSADTTTIPNTGGTITGTGYTFTSIGGFKYENGTTVTGNVNVSIRYIKPKDFESVRNAFPGQDFTGLGGGNEGLLYIYGWIAISYTQNVVRVYPATGSVNIKVQVPGVYANAARDGGKVFYYDEAAKIWEESANPTVSGLDVTMPLPSQATFCALGKMVPTTTIIFTKTSCMIGGNGYVTQLEFDVDRFDDYRLSLLGYCIDPWHFYSTNSQAGANLYPSGRALGVFNTWYGITWTNTEGEYGFGIGDYLDYETQTFTYQTGFDGVFKIHSIRIPLNLAHEDEPLSDKVIREFSLLPTGVTNLGRLNTICDGNIANPHDSNNPTTGNGQFIYNGQTISGTCTSVRAQTSGCNGIDVLMLGNETFLIRNMPTVSTGTFNVDGNDTNCNPNAITLLGGATQSTSGTIIKTGAKSFTFSITMKNISTEVTSVATGSGSYN